MDNPVIGFALTGSFCTFKRVLDEMERLKEKYPNIVPIFSHNSRHTDNRFGLAEEFCHRAEEICGRKCLSTLTEVEPIGPKHLLDALIVAPCTGNTLAKLSAGIADTPVTLAVKAHLRNQAPVILAVSTNDGLAANAQNIGKKFPGLHDPFQTSVVTQIHGSGLPFIHRSEQRIIVIQLGRSRFPPGHIQIQFFCLK
jgi:dipicolinate synthase subunit B